MAEPHTTLAQLLIRPLVDLNPMHWLGDAAKEGVADGFTAMMMSLWSAALWLLQAVFGLLDQFTSPELDNPGLARLYGTTAGISLAVAAMVAFGQLGLTALRRDGRPLVTLMIGLAQYGAVLTIWVGVCAALVVGCGGLTQALLTQLLGVDDFSGYAAGAGWVDHVTGTVESAVLGVCALFLLIPAAFGYLLIMLAREGALLVLMATFPIAAAGALGEGTRAWLWKSVRWFLVACLTSPLLALTLGLGVQIAQAAVPQDHAETTSRLSVAERPLGKFDGRPAAGTNSLTPATDGADAQTSAGVPDTAANVGMAVVGCVILLMGCFCPLALFRLLAFVDPGTGSGAAFRSTLSANGGVVGLLGGARHGQVAVGSGMAQQTAPDGRSVSEVSADDATATRFSAKLVRSLPVAGKVVGGVLSGLGNVATQGASLGVDVMAQTGVGHSYYDPAVQQRDARAAKSNRGARPAADPAATKSPASPEAEGPGSHMPPDPGFLAARAASGTPSSPLQAPTSPGTAAAPGETAGASGAEGAVLA